LISPAELKFGSNHDKGRKDDQQDNKILKRREGWLSSLYIQDRQSIDLVTEGINSTQGAQIELASCHASSIGWP